MDREIERLSQRFGSTPHILDSPKRSGMPSGVIAYWGNVVLKPLDAQSMAQLAKGENVRKGMLFDFLGNFGRSAREGFPIFQLGGGAGFVWGARFGEGDRGALRMTEIDASRFEVPVARDGEFNTGRSATGGDQQAGNTPTPAPKPKVNLSSGTGFFVSNEGHVLTNNHVVEDCSVIGVFMDQAEPVKARPVARDTTNDLALLLTGLTPPRVAAPRAGLRLGESVSAFGYPHADILSSGGNFTQGNVTALAGVRDDYRFLQTSAPVQAGNSGGPLLDENGNLVGMVTSKLNALKMAQANGDLPQNVNFALKASIIISFLDANRIKYPAGSATLALRPEELADQAKSMSVFILCQ